MDVQHASQQLPSAVELEDLNKQVEAQDVPEVTLPTHHTAGLEASILEMLSSLSQAANAGENDNDVIMKGQAVNVSGELPQTQNTDGLETSILQLLSSISQAATATATATTTATEDSKESETSTSHQLETSSIVDKLKATFHTLKTLVPIRQESTLPQPKTQDAQVNTMSSSPLKEVRDAASNTASLKTVDAAANTEDHDLVAELQAARSTLNAAEVTATQLESWLIELNKLQFSDESTTISSVPSYQDLVLAFQHVVQELIGPATLTLPDSTEIVEAEKKDLVIEDWDAVVARMQWAQRIQTLGTAAATLNQYYSKYYDQYYAQQYAACQPPEVEGLQTQVAIWSTCATEVDTLWQLLSPSSNLPQQQQLQQQQQPPPASDINKECAAMTTTFKNAQVDLLHSVGTSFRGIDLAPVQQADAAPPPSRDIDNVYATVVTAFKHAQDGLMHSLEASFNGIDLQLVQQEVASSPPPPAAADDIATQCAAVATTMEQVQVNLLDGLGMAFDGIDLPQLLPPQEPNLIKMEDMAWVQVEAAMLTTNQCLLDIDIELGSAPSTPTTIPPQVSSMQWTRLEIRGFGLAVNTAEDVAAALAEEHAAIAQWQQPSRDAEKGLQSVEDFGQASIFTDEFIGTVAAILTEHFVNTAHRLVVEEAFLDPNCKSGSADVMQEAEQHALCVHNLARDLPKEFVTEALAQQQKMLNICFRAVACKILEQQPRKSPQKTTSKQQQQVLHPSQMPKTLRTTVPPPVGLPIPSSVPPSLPPTQAIQDHVTSLSNVLTECSSWLALTERPATEAPSIPSLIATTMHVDNFQTLVETLVEQCARYNMMDFLFWLTEHSKAKTVHPMTYWDFKNKEQCETAFQQQMKNMMMAKSTPEVHTIMQRILELQHCRWTFEKREHHEDRAVQSISTQPPQSPTTSQSLQTNATQTQSPSTVMEQGVQTDALQPQLQPQPPKIVERIVASRVDLQPWKADIDTVHATLAAWLSESKPATSSIQADKVPAKKAADTIDASALTQPLTRHWTAATKEKQRLLRAWQVAKSSAELGVLNKFHQALTLHGNAVSFDWSQFLWGRQLPSMETLKFTKAIAPAPSAPLTPPADLRFPSHQSFNKALAHIIIRSLNNQWHGHNGSWRKSEKSGSEEVKAHEQESKESDADQNHCLQVWQKQLDSTNQNLQKFISNAFETSTIQPAKFIQALLTFPERLLNVRSEFEACEAHVWKTRVQKLEEVVAKKDAECDQRIQYATGEVRRNYEAMSESEKANAERALVNGMYSALEKNYFEKLGEKGRALKETLDANIEKADKLKNGWLMTLRDTLQAWYIARQKDNTIGLYNWRNEQMKKVESLKTRLLTLFSKYPDLMDLWLDSPDFKARKNVPNNVESEIVSMRETLSPLQRFDAVFDMLRFRIMLSSPDHVDYLNIVLETLTELSDNLEQQAEDYRQELHEELSKLLEFVDFQNIQTKLKPLLLPLARGLHPPGNRGGQGTPQDQHPTWHPRPQPNQSWCLLAAVVAVAEKVDLQGLESCKVAQAAAVSRRTQARHWPVLERRHAPACASSVDGVQGCPTGADTLPLLQNL